ncbi:1-(5-phosphoribosyl)-5-amino-4-imidazole-carboxylate carboxylase [Thermoplasmatales archaeon ex4484_30]|nr:MAG: 1-(5-phosphoribosyl)-5-amino-4-imidazole-carboxylate carboxylase [Thermoplasmatales archaeon ex4484_30]
MDVKEILKKVKKGEMSINEAIEILKNLPFKDIKFAKIDFHRRLRRGVPEAIYAPNKTKEQIKKIVEEMVGKEKIFITKAGKEIYEGVRGYKNCRYYEKCKMIVIGKREKKSGNGYILVASAGSGDISIAEEAAVTAEELGNEVKRIYDIGVAGVHRLVAHADEISKASVIIAVAGMDGILPTLISNFTSAPVIAVPTSIGYGTGMNGLAALMAMLNSCSPGIVVVNIDNGFGAGVAAHLIMRKWSE